MWRDYQQPVVSVVFAMMTLGCILFRGGDFCFDGVGVRSQLEKAGTQRKDVVVVEVVVVGEQREQQQLLVGWCECWTGLVVVVVVVVVVLVLCCQWKH